MAVSGSASVSLANVFFDRVEITKINIFEGTSDSAIASIRRSVFEFYKAFRNLAIVLSFAVLVYIALRMVLSNIAEEKAKYKAWLVNWLVGFGLLFVMSYIIVFVLNANSFLVQTLARALGNVNDDMSGIMLSLAGQTFWIPLTISFGSAIMYLGLSIITMIFVIIYIKRMITVSLLIVISPLITVTYSLDKIGNNKSEILNTWLREFLYNVLIQPFHCIIYMVFIGTAFQLIQGTTLGDFGGMVYALILTFSIFSAQKIVREIFGFGQSSSLTEKVAVVALVQRTVSNISSVVALKGARNDAKAAKKEKKLGGLKGFTMPGGEDVNGTELARLRANYQQELNYESKAKKAAAKGKPAPKRKSKTTIPNRRRLKNAPKFIKGVGRVYREVIGRTTGYYTLKRFRKNRKQRRHGAHHMKDRDYILAVAQSYREAIDPTMSNKDLADELDRIKTANPSSLNAKEMEFMVMVRAMQAQFKISDAEVRDALLNGTGRKRGWS